MLYQQVRKNPDENGDENHLQGDAERRDAEMTFLEQTTAFFLGSSGWRGAGIAHLVVISHL